MDNRNGVQEQIVENQVVGLGGNQFETGKINVAANTVIEKGTVLERQGDQFVPATVLETSFTADSDSATITITVPKKVVINPFDIQNKGAAAADMSLRAIISGPVRADLLKIDGRITTGAENDIIRGSAIIPIIVHDVSRTE